MSVLYCSVLLLCYYGAIYFCKQSRWLKMSDIQMEKMLFFFLNASISMYLWKWALPQCSTANTKSVIFLNLPSHFL